MTIKIVYILYDLVGVSGCFLLGALFMAHAQLHHWGWMLMCAGAAVVIVLLRMSANFSLRRALRTSQAMLDIAMKDDLTRKRFFNHTTTYDLSPDGQSITCLVCGKVSFHLEDVAQLYCGNCHEFHMRAAAADASRSADPGKGNSQSGRGV